MNTNKTLSEYSTDEIVEVYNELLRYDRQIKEGGAIASAAVLPDYPFTLDDAQKELYLRREQESKLTPAQKIEVALPHFIGSIDYYNDGMGFFHTDGIQFLAETAGAHWLIDTLRSWQIDRHVRQEEFQVWTLKVNLDKKSATLIGDDGNHKVIARQQIQYTDFPLPEIKLYVEHGCIDGKNECLVCLLPSEH